MLICMWAFALAPLVYCTYAFYLVYTDPTSYQGYAWLAGIVLGGVFPMFFFVYMSLPHNMQKNGGQGTTVIYDNMIVSTRLIILYTVFISFLT